MGALLHCGIRQVAFRSVSDIAGDEAGADALSQSTFKVAMKNVADPSKLIFLMSDPVHDCKKAVTNLHSSGKSEKHTKFSLAS